MSLYSIMRPLSLALLYLLGARGIVTAQLPPVTGTNVSTSPFFIRSWEVAQGLPSSTVSAITQTHDGYLWLGTDAGLARFDGVNCRVFGLADGLKNLQVSALLEDRMGTLWIGTAGGGLGKMTAGKIQMFTLKDGLAGDSISSLLENTNGDIWIGTHTGLSYWHDGRLETPGIKLGKEQIERPFIFDLAKDRRGDIWVATLHAGLLRWRAGEFSVADGEVVNPANEGSITNNPRCLLVDKQGRVWAGTREKTLLCFENGQFTRYGTEEGFPEVILNRLMQTPDGVIWAGSLDEGLFYFQNGKFNVVRKAEGLPDDAVLSLFTDKDNDQLLWIGTQSGGLSRLSPKKMSVYHVMNGTSECVLRSLAQTTNGDLWVGTFGQGAFRWHGTEFERIDRLQQTANGAYADISTWLVEALLGAQDGTLWWGAGPHLYQTQGGRIISQRNGGWLQGDRIWCFCEAKGGGLWVGTYNGQLRLVKKTTTTPVAGLSGKPITALVQQPDGVLWIGSLGDGLLRLENGRISAFTIKDGLGSDLIRALSLDPDGTLWIGSEGGGLTRLSHGKFSTFTTKQGLSNDTVLQILSDDDGSLWLGGNQGICRISKRVINDVAGGQATALHPLLLDTIDGMPTKECVGSFGAALKTADGKLCFATTKGIVVIDPRRQFSHFTTPTVLLEAVLMDGLPLAASGRTNQDGLPVYIAPPGNHVFDFHYTGLNYAAPERVQFKYQLAGSDPAVVEAGDERFVRYNILPPGTYRFHVTASSGNGPLNVTGAGLSLEVLPHLWQSNWFHVLGGLLLLVLVALSVRKIERRRYRARLRRLEQERAMEQERARIARDLHDELGSSLTSIAMLSDLEQLTTQGADRLGKLEKRVRKISVSSVNTVRSLDEIVWAVNPRNDSLRSLLSYLTQFTREQFEDQELQCRFQIPDDLPELPLPPDVRHNLFLTVREALTNVQKYARASELQLAARVADSQIEITVRDNGVGFDPASPAGPEHDGLGNMRQRLKNLGGQLAIESQSGQGTTVTLTVPVPRHKPKSSHP
ncbi:MAG TPA: two-component regulator propeller domain-containing protein [Verrucomicrobiae bacterium]